MAVKYMFLLLLAAVVSVVSSLEEENLLDGESKDAVEGKLSVPMDDGKQDTIIESPLPKFFGGLVGDIINQVQPITSFMSIKQILYFNFLFFCLLVLIKTLLLGLKDFINLKRTPLLIYKEVEDYKEVAPHPAPQYPIPHKDYGYTGGFKTPAGEHISYKPYHPPTPKHKGSHPKAHAAPKGHSAPPKGHYAPPKGHGAPPKGHSVPPKGHSAPPKGHFAPPKGHGAPPKGHFAPPKGHGAPPQGHYAPPKGHGAPPKGHQSPPKGHHPEPKPQYIHQFVETKQHGPPKPSSVVIHEKPAHGNEVSSYVSYKE